MSCVRTARSPLLPLLQAFQPWTWGPLFSAMAAPPLLASHVLMERLPRFCPQRFPILGPFFYMQQGKTPTTVLTPADCFFTAWFSNPLSFLCYHISFGFESSICPRSCSRPCPPPALWSPGTLVGLGIQSGTTETEQASSSAPLKLAIPSQFLRGFEERTHAEGPAQCQA